MKKHLRLILLGIISWIIPFIVSFLFFDKEGNLATNIFLFKSIMIVVGTFAAVCLLILYFKKIYNNFLREGIIVGIVWLALNLILDVVILVPFADMNINTYFSEIGLRYLSIPIISIGMGYLLFLNQNRSS